MAGLFSRLFRRGSRRQPAQLPASVETAAPTSVQLVKQLLATREPVTGGRAESDSGEPVEQLPSSRAEASQQVGAISAEIERQAEEVTVPESDKESRDVAEISPERLEAALQRLRQEIPASSEESSPGSSA